MTTLTKPRIRMLLKDIQKRLDAYHAAGGIPMKLSGEYRKEDAVPGFAKDLLVVVVDPTAENIRALEFAEAIGDVEKDLRAEGMDNVILVPAIGGD